MTRLRLFLPMLALIILGTGLLVFIASHGGMHGNCDQLQNDNPRMPVRLNPGQGVLLNRWLVDVPNLPWPYKLIFWSEAPALICSKGVLLVLKSIWPQFGELFPYGLSYLTYVFLIALPFVVAQWYWIGRISDVLSMKFGGWPDHGVPRS